MRFCSSAYPQEAQNDEDKGNREVTQDVAGHLHLVLLHVLGEDVEAPALPAHGGALREGQVPWGFGGEAGSELGSGRENVVLGRAQGGSVFALRCTRRRKPH